MESKRFPRITTNLALGEVVEEGRGAVRLPEGKGRGTAGHFEGSTTVLGSNLGLEGPPVLWIRVQSLGRYDMRGIIDLLQVKNTAEISTLGLILFFFIC